MLNRVILVFVIIFQVILVSAQGQTQSLLFGVAHNEDTSDYISAGKAYYYKIDPTNIIYPIDTIIDLSIVGDFGAMVDAGTEYLVWVKPDSVMYPEYAPTYYDTFGVDFLAKKINVDASNRTYSIDVYLQKKRIKRSSQKGIATIKGRMEKGSNWSHFKKLGPGDPFNGIDISLIDKSTNKPVATDISSNRDIGIDKDSAVFQFDSIPPGRYYIYCAMPGVYRPETDTTYTVLVEPSTKLIEDILVIAEDDHFWYESTGFSSTSINQTNHPDLALSIYPNPISNLLHLEYELPQYTEATIEILNIDGSLEKQLFHNEKQKAGLHAYAIPLTNYASGIYYLKISTQQGFSIKQFMKR